MEKRGIELLPPTSGGGRSKVISFWARTVGIPLILVLQLFFLGVLAFRVKLELDLRTLSSSVKEKEQILTESADFESTVRKTQLKLETIGQVRQSLCYSCAISKLNQLKPPTVTITNLTLKNSELDLTAETPRGLSFALFSANILKEDWINGASITAGSLSQDGNFVFTMELGLVKEKLQ